MHPACPNKKQNHLQNCLLRRTQFWVRKTFSKPASLKRASLVACPVAISRKVSLKPKHCASATLIQKFLKNEPKHSPKNGTLAVPFLGPHAQLSKRTKEKHFHGPIFGTVWRYQMRPQNRKIHSKGRPVHFCFRPTPYGSRQVVYQAGTPVAFCKFTELKATSS